MSPKKEDPAPCGLCHKSVGGKEGIQCEMCDKWTHSKCANISAEVYEFMSTNNQIHWFCHACNPGVGKIIKELNRIQEKMSTFESQIEKQMRDVREMQKEMTAVNNNMQQKIEACKSEVEKMKTKLDGLDKSVNSQSEQLEVVKQGGNNWSEVVAKQVDSELQIRTSDMQKMQEALTQVKEMALEEQDKENRRNNIILHRVPESQGQTSEERIKLDTQFSLQLFTAIKSGIAEEDIIRVTRLGKNPDDSERPRPLLVQLGGRLAKNLIMENVSKLQHADAKFKKVIVNHDMTKKEREECRVLSEEAKQKTANETSGEWIYVVRGSPTQMRILKKRRNH